MRARPGLILKRIWIGCLLFASVLSTGCSQQNAAAATPKYEQDSEQDSGTKASSKGTDSSGTAKTPDAATARDSTPVVLKPEAPGTKTIGNEKATIDISNISKGYIVVSYKGSNEKVRFQVQYESDDPYTYRLNSTEDAVFPLTQGDGSYKFSVFENVSGDEYATAFEGKSEVSLENEFLPFLYPNQYVKYDQDTQAVALGEELVKEASDDLDALARIYDYVVGNIDYDYDKAENVASGYLPVIDQVLDEKKGICFDYAAVMTCMLRTQRIPTQLVVGYSGTVYHAWISVYIDGVGWIHDIIRFDGKEWVRMDPTLAATNRKAEKTVENSGNYRALYYY
ncbi:transglutaminase-like domain-containing protein [Diplocloster hominis]|uniref:transglutaminase-like domain-containing protein n=1 Tax=Diplocloster hominis TaxID=3079010 RepID=UPI0031BB4B4E